MAPTPITTSGRLSIAYVVNGLTHKARLWVDIVAVGPSFEVVNHRVGGAGNKTGLVVAQMYWDLIKTSWPSTVTAPTFVLDQYSGGAFIPVDGAALIGAGTGIGAIDPCNEVTFTFKDTANKKMKISLFETIYESPDKNFYPTGVVALAAIFNDFISPLSTISMNDFARSKGDLRIFRAIAETVSLNRRIRRARHLA